MNVKFWGAYKYGGLGLDSQVEIICNQLHIGSEAQYFLISNLAEYNDFVFFKSLGALFHNFEASYLKESFVNVDPLFSTSVLFDTALDSRPFFSTPWNFLHTPWGSSTPG